MTPSHCRRLLITPLVLSSPIHAYTRSRNEIQNGKMMPSSRIFRRRAGWRAMK